MYRRLRTALAATTLATLTLLALAALPASAEDQEDPPSDCEKACFHALDVCTQECNDAGALELCPDECMDKQADCKKKCRSEATED